MRIRNQYVLNANDVKNILAEYFGCDVGDVELKVFHDDYTSGYMMAYVNIDEKEGETID